MTHSNRYTELDLRRLKGQALKDTWHDMIGKPPGLKNVTGLHSLEEIIQAILQKQSEREECLSEEIRPIFVEVAMPPKAAPRPQKEKAEKAAKPIKKKVTNLLAIESMEEPLEVLEVIRRIVQPKTIQGHEYYVEKDSNNVYTIKTGEYQGVWKEELESIQKA